MLDPEAYQREEPTTDEGVVLGEVQLVLAEKRTSLAGMRTGIAVFAIPLSVLSILIATSRFYDIASVLWLLVPVLAVCLGLLVLGSYLVSRNVLKILREDRLINEIKRKHGRIARFMD